MGMGNKRCTMVSTSTWQKGLINNISNSIVIFRLLSPKDDTHKFPCLSTEYCIAPPKAGWSCHALHVLLEKYFSIFSYLRHCNNCQHIACCGF